MEQVERSGVDTLVKEFSKLKATKNTAIKCLKCDKVFIFPGDKDDCLAHLYLEHRLVIADVEDIALLEDYLQYWQKEFQSKLIQNLINKCQSNQS